MKKLLIVLLVIIILGVGICSWWVNGTSPVASQDKTQKSFMIRSHENIRDIAYHLKQEGLIRDPIVFFLIIKQLQLDGKIQAGNFTLSPSMNTEQIAQTLTHGTTDIWITIPEGKRATEINEILLSKLPTYQLSWKNQLINQEGYLFPDTYRFPNDATIDEIVTTMKNNFHQKYELAQSAQTAKLTQEQAVILASIVEREAESTNDMRLAASVLENRLRIGMPLGSDVTLEYALGYQPAEKTWWKKDLTADDLNLNSPYNTRLNAGLPPTPISNPGLTALQAVLHPPQTNYLYYVSDNTGKLHFAETLEEHNANVEKYTQ